MTGAEQRSVGLIRSTEVDGRIVDVRIRSGRIAGVTDAGSASPKEDGVIDAQGGALLPGLHDHHIHLLALAAALQSVAVGPGDVGGADGFARALQAADATLEPGRWIRAVGYHESVAGPLDRFSLDRLVPGRAVRVQHRSGAMWAFNSVALALLGPLPNAEIGATGRLFGMDDWLRERVRAEAPDLGAVGRALASWGMTGVTDATPTERGEDLELLAEAVAAGELPLDVVVTGGLGLDPSTGAALERGPVKLVVADHALPELGELAAAVEEAHRRGRNAAIHCVTRVGLLLALAAWDEVGPRPGDRIEHGAVVHPEEAARIARLGVTVVTQPAFIATRGDDYLADVDPEDRPYLWRCAGLLEEGIPVAGSTDAPFGPADPWRAIAAAVERHTPAGRVLGAGERLAATRALELFLGPAAAPGGPPRRVEAGTPADLCLLRLPLEEALRAPSAEVVRATIRRGAVVAPR